MADSRFTKPQSPAPTLPGEPLANPTATTPLIDLPDAARVSEVTPPVKQALPTDKQLLKEASNTKQTKPKPGASSKKLPKNLSGAKAAKGRIPARGVREPQVIPQTSAERARPKQSWATCSAAWTPLPLASPLTWGLLAIAAIGYVVALWLAAPVPPVANPLVEPLLGAPLSPTYLPGDALPPPVTYVPALASLVLGTAVFGPRPMVWVLGVTLLAQWVFGVPLYANMGSVPQGAIGPTWGYVVGLWAAIALAGQGLCQPAGQGNPVTMARSRSWWPFTVQSSAGQVIRQKKESRRSTLLAKKQAARAAQAKPFWQQGMLRVWHIIQQTSAKILQGGQWLGRVFWQRYQPPMVTPLPTWAWVAQLVWASVISVGAAHALGTLGLMAWLGWQGIPTVAWDAWLLWPLNAALYDIPIAVALLMFVRPCRAALRWLLY